MLVITPANTEILPENCSKILQHCIKNKKQLTSPSRFFSESDLSSSSFSSSKCSSVVCGINCSSSFDLNSSFKMYGGKINPRITYPNQTSVCCFVCVSFCKYFNVGVFASSQTTHPQISENNLRTRMGQQCSVIGSYSETEASLTRPILKFARQQLLSLTVFLSVAVIQHLQSYRVI